MLLACLSTIVVPSQSLQAQQNLARSKPPPQTPSPRPVLPSLHQLRSPPTPISPRSIPVSSVPTTIPTASNRVEQFATKLREDMEAQERVLTVFIGRIKQKHQQSKLKLSRVSIILKGLKEEIANATKYADRYATEVTDQATQEKLIKDEYEKSWKMFSEERENIEFEKKFLEEIIKYIQLRKSNCLTLPNNSIK